MIATTATAPVRSTSGAPVTKKAAAIAALVADTVAMRARLVSEFDNTKESLEHLHRIDEFIVLKSRHYDYYNWVD